MSDGIRALIGAVLLVSATLAGATPPGIAAAEHCRTLDVAGNTPATITESGCYELSSDVTDANSTPVVTINASDVTLAGNGHTIDGRGDGTAIRISGPEDTPSNPANVTVRNVTVTEFRRGVHVTDFDGVTVRDATIHGGSVGRGVFFDGDYRWDEDSPAVTDNAVRNTTVDGFGYGVSFANTRQSTVADVTVTNTTSHGVSTDLASETNTYQSVVVRDAGEDGLYLSSGHLGVVRNATVRNASGAGVSIHGYENLTVRNSTFVNNSNGIVAPYRLERSPLRNVTVASVNVSSNRYNGIDLSSTDNVTIANATAIGNGGNGASFIGVTDMTVIDVTARHNDGVGLGTYGGTDGTITDSRTVGNDFTGVVFGSFEGVSNVTLSNHTSYGNGNPATLSNHTPYGNGSEVTLVSTPSNVSEDEVRNLTLSPPSDDDPTTVSFTGDNVSVRDRGALSNEPNGTTAIGVGVTLIPLDDDSRFDGTIGYRDSDLGSSNESTLALWSASPDNGSISWHSEIANQTHDPGANTVSANVTPDGPRIVAPLVEEASGDDGGGGGSSTSVTREPSVSLAPSTVSFDTVSTAGSGTETVTIRNDGDDTLYVESVSATAEGASISTSSAPGPIAAGSVDEVTVTAEPTAPGEFEGELAVETNDPDSPETSVALSGTAAAPSLNASTSELVFGAGPVSNATNITRTVTLANDGPVPATVEGVTVRGPNASQFDASIDRVTLAPGERVQVPVAFSPERLGRQRATLTVEGDTGLNVSLTGSGAATTLDATPSTVDYGTTGVENATSRSVTLRNAGATNVTVEAVRVAGPDADAFDVTAPTGTLAPNESLTANVTAVPTRAGNLTARLEVATATAETPVTVPLSARGIAPSIALDRDSLAFRGTTRNRTVTITNDGDLPLSVSTVRTEGSDAFSAGVSGNRTVRPGGSTTVRVAYDADVARGATGLLLVESNASETPSVYLSTSNVTARVTVEESDNVTRVNATVENVTAGEPASVPVPENDTDRDVDVDRLTVNSSVNESLTVSYESSPEELNSSPEFDPADEPRDLQYMSINASVPNEDIANVSIDFSIELETLNESQSDPEDVVVYRFENGTWEPQQTRLVAVTDGVARFQVIGSGFSEWTAAARQPRINVTDATASVTAATTDEDVEIRVRLANSGGADGQFLTQLLLNESVVEERSVTVAPNATRQVTFARTFGQPGIYDVQVNEVPVALVNISAQNRSVAVTEQEPGSATVTATPDEDADTASADDATSASGEETPTGSSGPADEDDASDGDDGSGGVPLAAFGGGVVVVLALGAIWYRRRE